MYRLSSVFMLKQVVCVSVDMELKRVAFFLFRNCLNYSPNASEHKWQLLERIQEQQTLDAFQSRHLFATSTTGF